MPEGLAVATVMAAKGTSPRRTLLWTALTALPQALVAPPAYVFVETFKCVICVCVCFVVGVEKREHLCLLGSKRVVVACSARCYVPCPAWLCADLPCCLPSSSSFSLHLAPTHKQTQQGAVAASDGLCSWLYDLGCAG